MNGLNNIPRRKIKILFMIGAFGTGGKERQLAELINGLDASRFEVYLFIKNKGTHYLEKIKNKVQAIYNLNRERFGFKAIADINNIIRTVKPDIVHSWADTTSLHCVIIKRFTSKSFKLIDGSIRSAGPDPKGFNFNHLARILINNFSDIIIANSNAGLFAFHVPTKKGMVVYNGFDFSRLEVLAPKEQMRDSLGLKNEFVIGMVARFEPQKDWLKFLRIARKFTEKHHNISFVCCGGGPELEKFRNEYSGFGSRIIFTGKRSDVESVIHIFNLGVLVSNIKLHGEGISNAILECMAMGVPVIANDCGGNREIIDSSAVGRIIQDENDESYIAAIEEFLNNNELLLNTGKAAKDRIQENFSYCAMISNYSDIYIKLHRN